MLFFNTKKNLWAGRELATDNSFILLWLHCGLRFILLFVLQKEQTLFSILSFQEEIFLWCVHFSQQWLFWPQTTVLLARTTKNLPHKYRYFTVSFSFEHGDWVGKQFTKSLKMDILCFTVVSSRNGKCSVLLPYGLQCPHALKDKQF